MNWFLEKGAFFDGDPFQDVDSAGEEFIAAFADSMDARQSDPKMESIVSTYLSKLQFQKGSLTVEVGAGAGAVTRRVGGRAEPEQAIAFEPSSGLEVVDFDLQSRTIADNDQMLPWVRETAKRMLERGEIGEELFSGLVAEYKRRASMGALYGYQVFATAIAKPS